ncbi:hypothetical protein K525DRAFT_253829 [Schizophyllum commune Loenen D]|nr:hypothetical protein K525DRAFT_253829 [Schizophyllum commune Loenen D]
MRAFGCSPSPQRSVRGREGDPPSSHPSTRDPARASGASELTQKPKWASPTSSRSKGRGTPSPIA